MDRFTRICLVSGWKSTACHHYRRLSLGGERRTDGRTTDAVGSVVDFLVVIEILMELDVVGQAGEGISHSLDQVFNQNIGS